MSQAKKKPVVFQQQASFSHDIVQAGRFFKVKGDEVVYFTLDFEKSDSVFFGCAFWVADNTLFGYYDQKVCDG